MPALRSTVPPASRRFHATGCQRCCPRPVRGASSQSYIFRNRSRCGSSGKQHWSERETTREGGGWVSTGVSTGPAATCSITQEDSRSIPEEAYPPALPKPSAITLLAATLRRSLESRTTPPLAISPSPNRTNSAAGKSRPPESPQGPYHDRLENHCNTNFKVV